MKLGSRFCSGLMGIIYQTIIRSHIIKDIESVPGEPWTENSTILAAKYLKDVKNNCLETHHEIYIDAQNKRNLHIMNYPIPPKGHSVSFTNFACDEYDGAYFEISFRFENGQTQTEEVFTNSSSLSRFMLIVPTLNNGIRAKSVSYEVGNSPASNCYDLKRYDGSKHSSTKDEFYKQFRCNDYGSRRCPVCYPDQQDSESETESESSVESVSILIPELELKSIKSVPESTTKSESTLISPESSGSKSDGKLVKSNIVSCQLQSIFHKIRAIFKYLDTNGILRQEKNFKEKENIWQIEVSTNNGK